MSAIFRPRPVDVPSIQQGAQQQAQQTQQPVPNNGTQQTQQTDANGIVPKQPDAPVSPLDQHKDLWQTPKPKEDEVKEEGVTPAQFFEAAGKVDFSRILNQEALANISKGGDDAVKSMAALLNQTAQAVYGQSMVAANKMVDQAVQRASDKFTAQVPGLVRERSAQEELYKANPALNNPVLAPIISAIQSQLAIQHPNVTADKLKEMASQILQGTANIINPTKSGDSTQNSGNSNQKGGGKGKQKEDEDWFEWVNYDENSPKLKD